MLHVETQHGTSSSAMAAAFGSASAATPNGSQDGVANLGFGSSSGGGGVGGVSPGAGPLTSPSMPTHFASQSSPNNQAQSTLPTQKSSGGSGGSGNQLPTQPHLKQPSPNSNSSSSSPSSFSGTFSAGPEASFVSSGPSSVSPSVKPVTPTAYSTAPPLTQQQQQQPLLHSNHSASTPSSARTQQHLLSPHDFSKSPPPTSARSHPPPPPHQPTQQQQQQPHNHHQQQQLQAAEAADRYNAAAAMMSLETATKAATRSAPSQNSALLDAVNGVCATSPQGSSFCTESLARQPQSRAPQPAFAAMAGAVAAKTAPALGWPPFTSPQKAPSSEAMSTPFLNASASRSAVAVSESYSSGAAADAAAAAPTTQPLNPTQRSFIQPPPLSPLSHGSREGNSESFFNQLHQRYQQQPPLPSQQPPFYPGPPSKSAPSPISPHFAHKDAQHAFLSQMHHSMAQYLDQQQQKQLQGHQPPSPTRSASSPLPADAESVGQASANNRPVLKSLKNRIVAQMLEGRVPRAETTEMMPVRTKTEDPGEAASFDDNGVASDAVGVEKKFLPKREVDAIEPDRVRTPSGGGRPYDGRHSPISDAGDDAVRDAADRRPSGAGSEPDLGGAARVETDRDGRRMYVCNSCPFADASLAAIHEHVATHYNEKCPLCDYSTTSSERLKNHIQHFHPNKMRPDDFPMDEDEDDDLDPMERFGGHHDPTMPPGSPGPPMDGAVSPGVASSGSGSDRLSSIPSLQALQAAAASQSVAPEEDLFLQQASQIATTASGRPKVFRCKQCSFVGQTKISFWEHSRVHIKVPEKLLACPKCPFVTEYKHHLEYHLRNHFGSKPFKCSKCNYSCVNLSMLRSHLKSHSNIYQYRCSDCTYATKYCHSLKLHLRKYNHKPATMLNSAGNPQPLPPELSSHLPGMPGSPGHGSPPGFPGGPLSPVASGPGSPRGAPGPGIKGGGGGGGGGGAGGPRKRLDMLGLPGIPLPPPGEQHPGAAAAAAFWQHHIAASQGVNPLLINGQPQVPPSHRPHSPRGDGLDPSSRDPSTPTSRDAALRDPLARESTPRDAPQHPHHSSTTRDPSRERQSPSRGGESDFRFHNGARPRSPAASVNGSPARCNLCEFNAPTKDLLAKHMLVHAAENNKDLCSLYGISSESLSEQKPPVGGGPGGAATEATRHRSLARHLVPEKHQMAMGPKPTPEGASVFGERNQTEVLSQVIAKYTENAGGGRPFNAGGGVGGGIAPLHSNGHSRSPEDARKMIHNGGSPPLPPRSVAALHGGVPPHLPPHSGAPPQNSRRPGHPTGANDSKMLSPGGLLQIQQHLQQQLMFAAAAGIQPNPALLAQALQAQAAYAAAAAAHGQGIQQRANAPSPAPARSPSDRNVEPKRPRSTSPETRSPSSRPRSAASVASAAGSPRVEAPPDSGATPCALDLSRGVESDRDMSPQSDAGGSASSGPPKKRPRKGPAFKLEQISARLQQRSGGASDDDDDGAVEEGVEAASPASAKAAPPTEGLDCLHTADLNSENGDRRWRREKEAATGAPPVEDGAVSSPVGSWEETNSPRSGGGSGGGSGDSDGSPGPHSSSPRLGGSNKRKSSIIKRYDQIKSDSPETGTVSAPSPPTSGSAVPGSPAEDRPVSAAPEATPDIPESAKGADKKGDFFECPHCDIAFRDCVMYTMHMGYHGFQDPFHCNMCGDSLGDKVSFFLHIARVAHR